MDSDRVQDSYIMKQRWVMRNPAVASTLVRILETLVCFDECLFSSQELTAEQKEMQQLARKFTKEEIVPNAGHYDKTGEVRSVNAHQFIREVHQEATFFFYESSAKRGCAGRCDLSIGPFSCLQ